MGVAEVESQLASDKAQSDAVKQFAQRWSPTTQDQHELKTLTQNKNIALPTDSVRKHKARRMLAKFLVPP